MPGRRSTRNSLHLARAVHAAGSGGPGLYARLRAIPRLVRAVRRGEYPGMSSAQLAMLLAGVGYVVSPIDVVPEGLLLVVGLVDDVLVIGWVVATLVRETEAFIAWEQGSVPSHVVPD
ncbi:YkvA family protein [Janibacter sp. GS2]|uniref:YkvA family protein n=1 Tax=Janibacter sp. GS2 TaxID=3442646 RepID=UPI003EC07579